MTATPLISAARRLLANVDRGRGDQADDLLCVPSSAYSDQSRFRDEIDGVFLRCPLLVALSCDVADPGSFATLTIVGRSLLVARGDDGVARAFLNVCRHRGAPITSECFGSARRFTCPYHSWVYDNQGGLVGTTARQAVDGLDVDGLVELPTAERSGAVFAVLTPGAPMDVDDWLGDMASALAILELDKLHRYREGVVADTGNWKLTMDGYIDGYHIGFLHRKSIGARSITDRNTYDIYGPHERITFAHKAITTMRDRQDDEWDLIASMSLVHFVFPNVSTSGLPGRGFMLSRILPGSTPRHSTVEAFQYFHEPMVSPEQIEQAEAKRNLYYQVTTEEDYSTVRSITDALPSMAGDVFRYGRNEPGNQNAHRWIDALIAAGT